MCQHRDANTAVTTTQTDKGSCCAKREISDKHGAVASIWCLVISLSLPWVTSLIVSVSKQPVGSQQMTGLILKPCWIWWHWFAWMLHYNSFNSLTKWIQGIQSIQGILSFLKQIHAWPRLIPYCVNISPHAYVLPHEFIPGNTGILTVDECCPPSWS